VKQNANTSIGAGAASVEKKGKVQSSVSKVEDKKKEYEMKTKPMAFEDLTTNYIDLSRESSAISTTNLPVFSQPKKKSVVRKGGPGIKQSISRQEETKKLINAGN